MCCGNMWPWRRRRHAEDHRRVAIRAAECHLAYAQGVSGCQVPHPPRQWWCTMWWRNVRTWDPHGTHTGPTWDPHYNPHGTLCPIVPLLLMEPSWKTPSPLWRRLGVIDCNDVLVDLGSTSLLVEIFVSKSWCSWPTLVLVAVYKYVIVIVCHLRSIP